MHFAWFQVTFRICGSARSPIERGVSCYGKAGKRLDIERMFLYNTEQVCAFIDISGSQTEYGRM
jgi:hypothetical protein